MFFTKLLQKLFDIKLSLKAKLPTLLYAQNINNYRIAIFENTILHGNYCILYSNNESTFTFIDNHFYESSPVEFPISQWNSTIVNLLKKEKCYHRIDFKKRAWKKIYYEKKIWKNIECLNQEDLEIYFAKYFAMSCWPKEYLNKHFIEKHFNSICSLYSSSHNKKEPIILLPDLMDDPQLIYDLYMKSKSWIVPYSYLPDHLKKESESIEFLIEKISFMLKACPYFNYKEFFQSILDDLLLFKNCCKSEYYSEELINNILNAKDHAKRTRPEIKLRHRINDIECSSDSIDELEKLYDNIDSVLTDILNILLWKDFKDIP